MDEFTLEQDDGTEVFCRRWLPSGTPRALVVVVHGASEHSGRYDGVAGVLWALNTTETSQRVEATLISPDDGQPHLPLRYGASFRETRGEDPGIHIKDVQVGGRELRNDADVTLDELRKGIRVFFDHEITAASIRRPTFYVSAELPVEFGGPDARDGLRVVPQPALYQPMVLPANLDPAGASVFWVLAPRTADWIEKIVLPMLAEVQDRLLLRLTLKGNFIWQETFANDRPDYLYLDGEAVERRGDKTQPSAMGLPSGDGMRGAGKGQIGGWARDVTGRRLPRASVGALSQPARGFPRLGPQVAISGSMKQFLAVSALGKDRPGLAHDLVRTISDCGASISDSRMLPLGGEFAMQLLVTGNWHAMARLESELGRLGEAAGLALQLRPRAYVEASRLAGGGTWHVFRRHLIPNAMPTVIVATSLAATAAITIAAGLSYLGVGVRPPTPSWGTLMRSAYDVVYVAPLYGVVPGVLVTITALSYTLIGNGLRRNLPGAALDRRAMDAARAAG